MKLRDFGLLTDENLDPDVVAFLRQAGFDVCDVCENGWQGATDVTLLRRAVAEGRVVITHDADLVRWQSSRANSLWALCSCAPVTSTLSSPLRP